MLEMRESQLSRVEDLLAGKVGQIEAQTHLVCWISAVCLAFCGERFVQILRSHSDNLRVFLPANIRNNFCC